MLKYCLPFFTLTSLTLWGSAETDLIDQRISELRGMLQDEERVEANKQVESQEHFIADWPKYSEDVEKIKQLEEKNEEIKREIDALEKRKQQMK
ncbi:MAG: hypothetical protein ACHQUC_09845 [Chlamydiales bacterium]